MKSLIMIVLVLGSIALFSCRRFDRFTSKEYTCDCTVEDYDDWYDWTAEYSDRLDAVEACQASNDAVSYYENGSSCTLID